MNYDIIKKPLITEKAMKLGDSRQYAFEVNINSNKIEIKKAIEELYEVKVESIRTLREKGKIRSRFTKRGRVTGKTPRRKKAYVTLKEGYSIEIVSGAEEQ
ncbi:MAG TPA: 50S ribosomal protein L23 [Bacteroidota bacterium]|nr:50S ribosomal protein L23 [Candidatus Kapabacteria bacterium]HRS01506.1 50S ribosomal protein L23 [Bacteroidota bacterium]HRT68244.1 50S ribosomal protein L23 [Bacteroidota bacterium]